MGSSPIKCFFIMAIKIVIGQKNGKCFQKELSREESEALYGKVLGETIKGELFNLQGTEFTITGGSGRESTSSLFSGPSFPREMQF